MNQKVVILFVLLIAVLVVVSGCNPQKFVPPAVSKTTSEEEISPEPIVEEVLEQAGMVNVKFTDAGFEPSTLTIKSGDKIVWENARSKNKAMLLGTQGCVNIKSPILNVGDNFEWTFTKTATCTFVDGILPSAIGKVVIE